MSLHRIDPAPIDGAFVAHPYVRIRPQASGSCRWKAAAVRHRSPSSGSGIFASRGSWVRVQSSPPRLIWTKAETSFSDTLSRWTIHVPAAAMNDTTRMTSQVSPEIWPARPVVRTPPRPHGACGPKLRQRDHSCRSRVRWPGAPHPRPGARARLPVVRRAAQSRR